MSGTSRRPPQKNEWVTISPFETPILLGIFWGRLQVRRRPPLWPEPARRPWPSSDFEMSLKSPDFRERYIPGLAASGTNSSDSAAVVEQYPVATVSLPLKLPAGSKLFFVGHGTPKRCKIGKRVISPFSCKIDLWYHSRIWPEQIELFVLYLEMRQCIRSIRHVILSQSAAWGVDPLTAR